MRISDWSSDVCSSDLRLKHYGRRIRRIRCPCQFKLHPGRGALRSASILVRARDPPPETGGRWLQNLGQEGLSDQQRSEEHTSELQSLMRISYAVFCLKKKNKKISKKEQAKKQTKRHKIRQ